jgi:hypothetical protein
MTRRAPATRARPAPPRMTAARPHMRMEDERCYGDETAAESAAGDRVDNKRMSKLHLRFGSKSRRWPTRTTSAPPSPSPSPSPPAWPVAPLRARHKILSRTSATSERRHTPLAGDATTHARACPCMHALTPRLQMCERRSEQREPAKTTQTHTQRKPIVGAKGHSDGKENSLLMCMHLSVISRVSLRFYTLFIERARLPQILFSSRRGGLAFSMSAMERSAESSASSVVR